MRSVSTFLSLSAILLSSSLAQAQHTPHQEETVFPFRCPRAGICLQTTGQDNVVGGVRHGDEEIRFHAIYKPSSNDANSETYCVVISDTNGNIVATSKDRSACSKLDPNDTDLFGVKATTNANAKRVSSIDATTQACIEHIVAAEMRPDNFDAWGAIQSVAQAYLKDQADKESDDDKSDSKKSDTDSSDDDQSDSDKSDKEKKSSDQRSDEDESN